MPNDSGRVTIANLKIILAEVARHNRFAFENDKPDFPVRVR